MITKRQKSQIHESVCLHIFGYKLRLYIALHSTNWEDCVGLENIQTPQVSSWFELFENKEDFFATNIINLFGLLVYSVQNSIQENLQG